MTITNMQIDRKSTFFLGIFIFIIPFLGFPSTWKMFLTVVAGVLLVLLSIKISIPKKPSRYKTQRERVTPVFVENTPIISPRNDTIEVASRVPTQEVHSETKVLVKEVKTAPKRSRVTKKSNGPVI